MLAGLLFALAVIETLRAAPVAAGEASHRNENHFSTEIYNARSYGAKGDGVTDDSGAIMRAYRAACAASGSSPPAAPSVSLPVGVYRVVHPLVFSCKATVAVRGDGPESTVIVGSEGQPLIVTEPTNYMTSLGVITKAPLVNGTGNSLSWSDQPYYLNLKDALSTGATATPATGAAPLNGLTSFTVEAFFKWEPKVSRPYCPISSDGNETEGAHFPPTGAFYVEVGSSGTGGTLQAGLKINRSVVTLVGDKKVTPHAVHHVALVHDASSASLFLDGRLVARQAALGTISQGPFEDMMLGAHTAGWPELGGLDPWAGQIDSVRLSRVARYRKDFAPARQKLTGDRDTLLLLNFDRIEGSVIGVDYLHGRPYTPGAFAPSLVVRNYGMSYGQRQVIDGLALSSGSIGLLAAVSTNSVFTHLDVLHSGYVGIKLFNNTFLTLLAGIRIIPSGYAESNFEAMRAAGVLQVTLIQANGAYSGIALNEGSAQFNQPYINTSFVTRYAIVIKQDTTTSNVTLIEPSIDTENGGEVVPVSISGNGAYTFVGGDLEVNSASSSPAVIVTPAHMEGVTFVGTHVELGKSAPEVVRLVGTGELETPLTWVGPVINGMGYKRSPVRFTNAPGAVIVIGDPILNQDIGLAPVHFGDLPRVENGHRLWCDNCDPPLNPPNTCRSRAAKTGAFADGVNGQWICTY